MTELKENKIYKESYLIRIFLKEFNNTYNTDWTLNCYDTYTFYEFLRDKGFIDIDKDLYLYNKEFNKYLKDKGI